MGKRKARDYYRSEGWEVDAIMEQDRSSFLGLRNLPQPLMHLYHWESPTITHGYFSSPRALLQRAKEEGIPFAPRPTGGGVTLHGHDATFSLFVPAHSSLYSTDTMKNYRWVHTWLMEILTPFFSDLSMCEEKKEQRAFDFCSYPVSGDIMQGKRKLVGGAQRRSRYGWMHQGSLFLASPPDILTSLVGEEGVAKAPPDLPILRESIYQAMIQSWRSS
ncbi:MAG: hypothetical protein VXZ72_05300 [Chlamydiota bacterium]|nr:hypothetical protein [Chlamydiota bacterium]